MEYRFKGSVSLALQPAYSFFKIGELYAKPTLIWGPFGEAYHYIFSLQTLSLPLTVNYYTNTDDEKAWIFSVGAGLNFITSMKATCQTTSFFGGFSVYKDTVYNLQSLSAGNVNTLVRFSITKKFKTSKPVKPYLRFIYQANTDPWRFPAIHPELGTYFMRPNFSV